MKGNEALEFETSGTIQLYRNETDLGLFFFFGKPHLGRIYTTACSRCRTNPTLYILCIAQITLHRTNFTLYTRNAGHTPLYTGLHADTITCAHARMRSPSCDIQECIGTARCGTWRVTSFHSKALILLSTRAKSSLMPYGRRLCSLDPKNIPYMALAPLDPRIQTPSSVRQIWPSPSPRFTLIYYKLQCILSIKVHISCQEGSEVLKGLKSLPPSI